MKTLISFIIPTYNSSHYILKCLDTLINSKCKCFECLVIDDGSTDNIEDILLPITLVDNRFSFYKKNNSGAGMTRQYGLNLAKGKYVAFIDSDDKICEKYFDAIVPLLDMDYDFIVFNYNVLLKNKKQSIYKVTNKTQLLKGAEMENFYLSFWGPNEKGLLFNRTIRNCVFKKAIVDQFKFYDERKYFSEDTLFLLSYIKNTRNILLLNEFLYYHNLSDYSLSNSYLKYSAIYMINNLYKKEMELISPLDQNKNYINDCIIRTYLQNLSAIIKKLILNRCSLTQLDLIKNEYHYKLSINANVLKKYPTKTKLFWFLFKHSKYKSIRILLRLKK